MTNKKIKLLELTSDPVFKAFIMSKDTREYTARLINLITGIPEIDILKNSVFNNIEIPVRNKKDKKYRTDIIITVGNNIINMEMNQEYYNGLFNKNNAYKSRIFGDQFDEGDNYKYVKKIISINIDNFSKFNGNKLVYKFVNSEVDTGEIEEENNETYHIDLAYLKNKCYNNDELNELEKLLEIFVRKRVSIGGDKLMESAVRKLESLSSDEKIIGLYDADAVERKIWKTKMMYAEELGLEKGLKKGLQQGIKQGIKQGIEQGIEQGIKEDKIEIAKNMIKKEFNRNVILEITGLPEEELNLLY